uniref:DUF4455 domain-containing protein n=1 Tax=Panagrellus redivivus TaxID=6233 RepID=A0A7E4ZX78_PANRE
MSAKTAIELSELDDETLKTELAKKDFAFYRSLKHLPDPIAKRFHELDVKRRWAEHEARVKVIEDRMTALNPPDKSVAEDRFEILAELLDKACQAFEINDEHETRRVPWGHRLVLEARLLESIKEAFDLIEETVDKFGEMGEDRQAANCERADLRLEIRLRDLMFTEVHERFLKSYLEMEW